MRELSVYYCSKCGYYAYYQLPKNAVCHTCNSPMTRLDINHRDFTNLDYEERDRLIAEKMIESTTSLVDRITAPEKLYHQRKLVGVLTQHIRELEKEIDQLNDTINWMHTTIWDELRKKQGMQEEIRQLKELISQEQTEE